MSSDERADASPAESLLAAVGLPVGGSVPWGSRVPSRSTGVYIVETEHSHAAAPVDPGAVSAWLDRISTLIVDGRRPTATELMARLASFWLPSRRIVYIGRSSRPLVDRVGEFYSTPLGNRSPHAGGHWLKTLSVLAQSRVWWAPSLDFLVAEGRLFTAFAATVPDAEARSLYDPALVLPFANLENERKLRKSHGIGGAKLR
jgi:hypothetical protein